MYSRWRSACCCSAFTSRKRKEQKRLPCLYTIAFPLTALLAALIARSVLQPGILCSLAVSTAAFVLVDLITAVTLLAGGRSELSAIALRAVQELALSLPLLIVCHPVLAFLHRKFTL